MPSPFTKAQAAALVNLLAGRPIMAHFTGREWVVKKRRACQTHTVGKALCDRGFATLVYANRPQYMLTGLGLSVAMKLTNPLSGDRAGRTPVAPNNNASGPS